MQDNTTPTLQEQNRHLIHQVKQLEGEIKKLQDSLERSKEFIDLDATKAPIKLYIVGKYNSFDNENAYLDISVDGISYKYPIESYGSSRLPFPDSRVLIFNREGEKNRPYIFSFESGRLIECAPQFMATVSAINLLDSTVLLSTQIYGNIKITPSAHFFETVTLKNGMQIMIKRVQYGTEYLFIVIQNEFSIELDNDKIYTFLSQKIGEE